MSSPFRAPSGKISRSLTHPSWAAIGVIVAVLGIVVTVVIAKFQTESGSSPDSVGTAASTAATGSSNATGSPARVSRGASPSPTVDLSWTLLPAAIFKSGSPRLSTPPHSITEHRSWDLDTNVGHGLGPDAGKDVEATLRALGAQNGAVFAPLAEGVTPTLATCATTVVAQWIPAVHQDDLKPKSVFCILTSSGRYGYLSVQSVAVHPKDTYRAEEAGAIEAVSFSFVVWKKPGDS